jgi:hypothetical protein
MIRTTRISYMASALALCVTLFGALAPAANAASISYGTFAVPPAMFIDVTESSGTDPVPLYGPPTPFAYGLDFDPTSFVATATGGGADVTDGQLNYTIMSPGLLSLNVSESGDYSIAGPAPTASVFAGASARATVTQINGVNVAPFQLTPVNGSVGFSIPPNQVVQPWAVGLTMNVGAQVAAQFGAGARATKVEIVIDNTLLALSSQGTLAFIAKKDFFVDHDIVPEPTSLGLASMVLCGLGMARKRR